jgi:lysine biosynthesis protein LysW
MSTGFCPECDNDLKLDRNPYEGMFVTCPHCGAYLTVVRVSPLEFDWADEDEDYNDEDDYDDDY